MGNDRLRTAMLSAGVRTEQLAAAVGVDPKTVERWIGSEDRVPHRSNREAIATKLNQRDVDLWPSLSEKSPTAGSGES